MVVTYMGRTLLVTQVTYVTWTSAAAVESGGNTSDYLSPGPRVTMQDAHP